MLKNIYAVVLAAGKGSRMKSKHSNKVTLEVAGKPMILRTLEILNNSGIKKVVVVVGFAKESVLKLLPEGVENVEQKRRLGTGHAVKTALTRVPDDAQAVLVVNGDDSFLYQPRILKQLIDIYWQKSPAICLLSLYKEDPTGLGRIVRNGQGQVIKIVEEKDCDEDLRKIQEVNAGCYLFNRQFLKKFINKIPKNPLKKEYYLTSLVDLAVQNRLNVAAVKIDHVLWQGVNTREDLAAAEKIVSCFK